MGFMSFITGANQVDRVGRMAEKGLGGIMSGLDHIKFTPEERSEFVTKGIDSHLKLMEALNGESTTRSISRRYMAFFIMGMAMVSFLFSVAIYRIDAKWALFAVDSFVKISTSFAVGSVVVFFFGSHLLGRVMGK